MSYEVDGCYDLYQEKCVRARKRHACSACDRTIESGHRYVRVHWIYERNRGECKRCGSCQTLHLHLRKIGGEAWWPDETLSCGRTYEDEWGTVPPTEIARLPLLSDDEASSLLTNHPSLSDDSYDIR